MKNYLFFILCFIMSIFPRVNAQALTTTDFELKTNLENVYEAKIKKFHFEQHVNVNVTLSELRGVDLDLIGGKSHDDESIESRVKLIEVTSDGELLPQEIATLTGLNISKIKFTKHMFEERTPASEKPATPSKADAKTEATSHGEADSIQSKFSWIQLGVFGFIFAIGAFAIFGLKKAIRGLSEGFSSIAETLRTTKKENQPEKRRDENVIIPNHTRELSDLQLKAMFAECYWTFRDQEASAFIRVYPKIEVFKSLRFGENYIEYLKTIDPISTEKLVLLEDPYYITPNSSFFEMSVDDTPIEALLFASQFRFEKKGASSSELIQAQVNGNSNFKLEPKLSLLRKLTRSIRVQFKNIAEEDAILTSNNIQEAIKLQLPSLYCLKPLTAGEFQRVIDGFSLQELARGWVGPEWLLTELELKMNDRKRVLFKEIREQIQSQKSFIKSQAVFESLVQSAKTFHSQEVKRIAA